MFSWLRVWGGYTIIMMTSSNGNIFCVTGHLCGEFTGPRWIPHTKASDAELWCFSLICTRINGWVNNREAGDLRRHRAHYDVIVMILSVASHRSREHGALFPLALCSLWCVRMIGYMMAWSSYLFVCILHTPIIIIMQTYLTAVNIQMFVMNILLTMCLGLSLFPQLSFMQYMELFLPISFFDSCASSCSLSYYHYQIEIMN